MSSSMDPFHKITSDLRDLNIDSKDFYGNSLPDISPIQRRRSRSVEEDILPFNDSKFDFDDFSFNDHIPNVPHSMPDVSTHASKPTWHVSVLSDFQVYEEPRSSLSLRNRQSEGEPHSFKEYISAKDLQFMSPLRSSHEVSMFSGRSAPLPSFLQGKIEESTRRPPGSVGDRFEMDSQSERPSPTKREDEDSVGMTSRKIFVGRVPKEVTLDLVVDFFSQFGAVESADVNADRGCCFVTFEEDDAVDRLLDGKNVQYFDFMGAEQQICVRKYVIIEKDKLFVRGLSAGTTKEDLFQYFKQFGKITHVNLHQSRPSMSPFAFIRFVKPKSVNQIMARNDHEIKGRTVHCLRAHRQ